MAWQPMLIVFAVSFVVTFATVPLSKRIAHALGAIDYPSNRRVNADPVPRCGGIALYLGMMAGAFTVFLGMRFFGWTFDEYYRLKDVNFALLFMGATVMFAVGLVDDITQIRPLTKFAGQIAAAVIVVAAGVSIGSIRAILSGDFVNLEWLDAPLSVLYLVVFVNITNLIDGLDGLASGMTAIVATALLYLVMRRGSMMLAFACVMLIAVCLAFLRYNFFPASVFMGDSGSLLLGLMLGIISIEGVVRTQSAIVMLVPLAIAGVPVLDTLSAIVRRLRGHESIGHADLEHVHHRLLRAGLSQKRSVAVLWACTAALGLVGCLITDMSGYKRWAMFFALGVVVLLVIWKFGLFKPVLKHHYDNQGKLGPRTPRTNAAEAQSNAGAAGGAGSAGATASAPHGAASSRSGTTGPSGKGKD